MGLVRQAEHRHLEEEQQPLTLRRDKIKLFQGCSKPDDSRQSQQDDEKRVRRLPKHVSAEERHDLFSDVPRLVLMPAP